MTIHVSNRLVISDIYRDHEFVVVHNPHAIKSERWFVANTATRETVHRCESQEAATKWAVKQLTKDEASVEPEPEHVHPFGEANCTICHP